MTNLTNVREIWDSPIVCSWRGPNIEENQVIIGAPLGPNNHGFLEYIGPSRSLCVCTHTSTQASCARMCSSFGANTCVRAHLFINEVVMAQGSSGPRAMTRVWLVLQLTQLSLTATSGGPEGDAWELFLRRMACGQAFSERDSFQRIHLKAWNMQPTNHE